MSSLLPSSSRLVVGLRMGRVLTLRMIVLMLLWTFIFLLMVLMKILLNQLATFLVSKLL